MGLARLSRPFRNDVGEGSAKCEQDSFTSYTLLRRFSRCKGAQMRRCDVAPGAKARAAAPHVGSTVANRQNNPARSPTIYQCHIALLGKNNVVPRCQNCAFVLLQVSVFRMESIVSIFDPRAAFLWAVGCILVVGIWKQRPPRMLKSKPVSMSRRLSRVPAAALAGVIRA
jgi:hypothetical protein